MDFSRPYAASWRLFKVDPMSWADAYELKGVVGASVTRNRGTMLESGTIDIMTDASTMFDEGYYRLVMNATQNDTVERFDIATLYCSHISGTFNRGADTKSITGRSVLVPAASRSMVLGSYIAGGTDGVRYVTQTLSEVLDAPVLGYGSFYLSEDYVFDLGSKVIDVIWTVLDAGNYCLMIDGRGIVNVVPMPTVPQIELPRAMSAFMFPEVTYEFDMSEIPNRYSAISSAGEVAYATNESPDSPVSTYTRGFIVDADSDTSPTLVNGESLEEYCQRRLYESSVLTDSRSYEREYIHGLLPNMVIAIDEPKVGMSGIVRVDTQSINCENGITVSESVVREVNLWV